MSLEEKIATYKLQQFQSNTISSYQLSNTESILNNYPICLQESSQCSYQGLCIS